MTALPMLTESRPWFLRLASGIEVAVPPSLAAMTSYVLVEQEDWFESELAFVRPFLKPGPDVGEWAAVGVVETFDCAGAYSSYFKPNKVSIPLLEHFKQSRFFGPAMERRRQLERLCAGQQGRLEPTKLVATANLDHLNPEIWVTA